ncbi:helix-turn-helix domain-containing GNAT family N-acetyltransferase [Shimia sp. SDUM112013]|uniref:bifunctional helix-turn-helix transcriptional regulator/GNAT family N-acetyltransferase n=1 Tax=Shimia sp. SDUM112013 TaxID=3136160 RepID=UPI0032EE7F49
MQPVTHTGPDPVLVNDIRHHARHLVRELGFMGRTVAGSDLSSSAVHTLIELGLARTLTAKDLKEKLLLEKSTVSRLVQTLLKRGLLQESRDPDDARTKQLSLTAEGCRQLAEIEHFAIAQVSTALGQTTAEGATTIRDGLRLYADALREARHGASPAPAHVETGYTPGLLAAITGLHAQYYSKLVGFGCTFESAVASGMADFLPRLDAPVNQTWWVNKNGAILGGISIDGEDLGNNTAHLRWFYVDESLRGHGLGKALIGAAMDHCRAHGFDTVDLWTFKGLDTARALYLAHGFDLVEEQAGTQWGKPVLEQKYRCVLT